MVMKARFCELCSEPAAVYCESDSAFLCWNCDFRVHGANFLVARHVRRTLCTKCDEFDGGSVTTVTIRLSTTSLCRSCSSESPPINDDGDGVSVCVSRAESLTGDDSTPVSSAGSKPASKTRKKKKRVKTETKKLLRSQAPAKVDDKAEAILVNWCRMMGLNSKLTVHLALQAFNLCLTKLTRMQYRVILTSSFWFSIKLFGKKTDSASQNLKRLEQISGVPAKLIIGVERKMELALKERKIRVDQEEGWAES